MTDFYKILGVTKSASQDEIKQAYRRLASKFHPDKGGDTAKFQQIEEAYRILGNPEKRSAYDNPQPQFQQFNGVPPGFEEMFGMFGGHPFNDIFNHRQRSQRNLNLSLQTQITLEDAQQGKDITFSVSLPSGREQVCEIRIPKGVQEGTTLRLAGMGDDSIPNIPRGDIHLTIHIQPHPVFQRQGDDLIKSLEISVFDAILGKKINVETLDKRLLEVTIQPGTQPGAILAIQGHGMPNLSDNRFVGRLLIQLNIKIPTNLTPDQIEKIKEIDNIK